MKRLPLAVCALVALHLAVLPCKGDILDPNAFASLGAFPTAAGVYIVDGSFTATISLPGGGSIQGVFFNGLTVFDFDSINITPGMTFVGNGLPGSRFPIVLLSRGNAVIAGTVDVSAVGGLGGPGGFSGNPDRDRGDGPGGGGTGHVGVIHTGFIGAGGGGGGGFGGPGDRGQDSPVIMPGSGGDGGRPYGDITKQLVGGSAGGAAFVSATERSGPGGGGGGAVEIGAIGTLTISGTIRANGGYSAQLPPPIGAGAGSGGAILLHGNSVALGGTLSALGGLSGLGRNPDSEGGTAAGGAGGGGRIAVLYNSSYSQTGVVNIGNGSFIVAATVPEPSPLWLSTVVSAAGLTGYLWRRARGSKL
jgi:hypothetical protein